jgi:hypothetical protein
MAWGPGGSSSSDVTLTRSGAGVLTLNPGAFTVNGVITGDDGATISDGVTLVDQSLPSTPTAGPILYGSSTGYLKYVGTDGNPYTCGRMLLYNGIGNQSITLATQTGLQATNGASSQMNFPLVSGTFYAVQGYMYWSTTGTTYQRMNFGNVNWVGQLSLNTWDANVSNSATLSTTIQANGVFDMPLNSATNEGGNIWETYISGLIEATATGTLLVQGGCSPGPGASWTFGQYSWFSFEPIS